ncbi:hypothetical protein RA2_00368 [Roseovarius sp. A-2]|uniref:DUF2141 domain-containing protein n=1 Tax=Roseovarius sp. A-2 TaxID=1570360 RepID=UPI0009B545F2|nr:DUF2141 domain-containing protein [Roseovarius sp. A-2]GAW33332.1 hypothetical protein RA2_00368 [Roseovarius sp. A-2]
MFSNRNSLVSLLLGAFMLTAPGAAPASDKLDIRPHEAPATCGARAPQIRVVVENVTAQGILTVELYQPSEKDFLKKASRLHRIRVPAEQGPQTVCFDVDSAGRYAIAAYQDLDADRDLDQKWNMMPAEPFALSSNKKLALRMPVFDDAAFEVPKQGVKIRIRLQK